MCSEGLVSGSSFQVLSRKRDGVSVGEVGHVGVGQAHRERHHVHDDRRRDAHGLEPLRQRPAHVLAEGDGGLDARGDGHALHVVEQPPQLARRHDGAGQLVEAGEGRQGVAGGLAEDGQHVGDLRVEARLGEDAPRRALLREEGREHRRDGRGQALVDLHVDDVVVQRAEHAERVDLAGQLEHVLVGVELAGARRDGAVDDEAPLLHVEGVGDRRQPAQRVAEHLHDEMHRRTSWLD